jgi:hypothetical protein
MAVLSTYGADDHMYSSRQAQPVVVKKKDQIVIYPQYISLSDQTYFFPCSNEASKACYLRVSLYALSIFTLALIKILFAIMITLTQTTIASTLDSSAS